jgi:co-chaperonin GroES (HSP10)
MSKVALSRLKPIRDNIVIVDMDFGEQVTKGGLVILSDDGKSEGVKSRWGRVHSVGPMQVDVKAGEWILLEHGRWSRGFTVLDDDGNDIIIRRADPKGILAVADEKPNETIYGAHSTVTHATVDPGTFARPSFEY